ncbi:hypothetical protein [Halorubrum distributum]|uniref:hypothetical protein n=1 Tax=Halorubrum distributum TaxID=29283 RepID=UPI0012670FAF|nr:hypothetical protein [Halorubrum distributum]
MNRRTLIGTSVMLATPVLAGCSSDGQNQSEPSGDDSENESESVNSEQGPVGPADAVEHYDKAIELLGKNAEVFNEVRQELLLEGSTVEFSSSEVKSRTSEARSQLDSAEQDDDGSLSDHIDAMRVLASYQDSLADYNEEYLRLTSLVNTGVDEYFDGQHQSAIDILQEAQEQISPTRSSLEEVGEKLDEVLEAAEVADLSDQYKEEMLVAGDQFAEVQEELAWLNQIVPARIAEVEGDRAFELGTNAFDNEEYGTARSHYADSENHFVSAETHLDNLQVQEITSYIEELVSDAESLNCEYRHSSNASDEMVQASEAMENNQSEQANQHIEAANTQLSKIDTC